MVSYLQKIVSTVIFVLNFKLFLYNAKAGNMLAQIDFLGAVQVIKICSSFKTRTFKCLKLCDSSPARTRFFIILEFISLDPIFQERKLLFVLFLIVQLYFL